MRSFAVTGLPSDHAAFGWKWRVTVILPPLMTTSFASGTFVASTGAYFPAALAVNRLWKMFPMVILAPTTEAPSASRLFRIGGDCSSASVMVPPFTGVAPSAVAARPPSAVAPTSRPAMAVRPIGLLTPPLLLDDGRIARSPWPTAPGAMPGREQAERGKGLSRGDARSEPSPLDKAAWLPSKRPLGVYRPGARPSSGRSWDVSDRLIRWGPTDPRPRPLAG